MPKNIKQFQRVIFLKKSAYFLGRDILRYISKTSSDGSTTLYNEDGSIKGFKNKRICTLKEANEVIDPINRYQLYITKTPTQKQLSGHRAALFV